MKISGLLATFMEKKLKDTPKMLNKGKIKKKVILLKQQSRVLKNGSPHSSKRTTRSDS